MPASFRLGFLGLTPGTGVDVRVRGVDGLCAMQMQMLVLRCMLGHLNWHLNNPDEVSSGRLTTS